MPLAPAEKTRGGGSGRPMRVPSWNPPPSSRTRRRPQTGVGFLTLLGGGTNLCRRSGDGMLLLAYDVVKWKLWRVVVLSGGTSSAFPT